MKYLLWYNFIGLFFENWIKLIKQICSSQLIFITNLFIIDNHIIINNKNDYIDIFFIFIKKYNIQLNNDYYKELKKLFLNEDILYEVENDMFNYFPLLFDLQNSENNNLNKKNINKQLLIQKNKLIKIYKKYHSKKFDFKKSNDEIINIFNHNINNKLNLYCELADFYLNFDYYFQYFKIKFTENEY